MKKLIIKYKELILYLIFGVLTMIVSLSSYYLLTKTILNPNKGIELQIANIISWVTCVTFAYITNRKYVFKSKNEKKIKEILSFYLSRISSLIVEMTLMYIFVTILNYSDSIMKLINQVIITILNYILSKLIVFKKEK
ncbi:MAG: GtrA family protein [Bacilli bacterium]|nr:GtrA family protein [Bacilli bacterium]